MRVFDWNNWNRLARGLALLGLALGLVLSSLAISDDDEPENSCVLESCHADVYSEGTSNPFLHEPFFEKQCEACHLNTETVTANVNASASTSVVAPVIVTYPDFQTEYTIVLRGLNARATYDFNITFQDEFGNKAEKEFSGVVPGDVQDVRVDDKKPPEISNVKVGPIAKRIFLETVIKWETEEPSTSSLEYGFSDQYGQYTSEDNALVKKHSVNIYELEEGRVYHFRVISRDIFGNEAASQDLEVNTAEISSESEVEEEGASETGDEKGLAVIKAQIFIISSDLGLQLETTAPVSVTVEYIKVAEPVEQQAVQVDGDTTAEGEHVELRDGAALNIDACYQCHPAEDLGVSHPVGMGPSEKTKIPDDLPTLEGGILTCVTCHDPHGGIRRYFARKDISKDICISCHEGYYLP